MGTAVAGQVREGKKSSPLPSTAHTHMHHSRPQERPSTTPRVDLFQRTPDTDSEHVQNVHSRPSTICPASLPIPTTARRSRYSHCAHRSHTVPAPAASFAATTTPALRSGPRSNPGATVEYLRDLVQKRLIILTYMRNVHDGCVSAPPFFFFFCAEIRGAVVGCGMRCHWFHTVIMSRVEPGRMFNNTAMKRCICPSLLFFWSEGLY
jgi:hypothetical protein